MSVSDHGTERKTTTPATDTAPEITLRPRARTPSEERANTQFGILEALMGALTTGDPYRVVERDGELHLVERGE